MDVAARFAWASVWFPTALLSGACCVASYKLSGAVSLACSKSYGQLTDQERRDWNSRLPSTLHALVITALAARIIIFSDLYADETPPSVLDVPSLLRVSAGTNVALGVSLGYFMVDLGMMFRHYPDLGGAEMVAHHIASLVAVARALLGEYAHLYTLAMLSTEVTTPCINARWQLDRCGLKGSAAYVANGMAVMGLWAVNRIAMFAPFFLHVWGHRQEVAAMERFDLGLVVGVPLLLLCLNVYWFSKILRGALRMLRGSEQSKAEALAEEALAGADKRQPAGATAAVTTPNGASVRHRSAWQLPQTKTEAAAGHS